MHRLGPLQGPTAPCTCPLQHASSVDSSKVEFSARHKLHDTGPPPVWGQPCVFKVWHNARHTVGQICVQRGTCVVLVWHAANVPSLTQTPIQVWRPGLNDPYAKPAKTQSCFYSCCHKAPQIPTYMSVSPVPRQEHVCLISLEPTSSLAHSRHSVKTAE